MKLKVKDDSLDMFRKKCRENKLKITPQRIIIYRELKDSKDHPHADALYQRVKRIFPNISLDTVNRTLLTFSEIGLVKNVEGYGDPSRYEPDLSSHHHFRCVRCKALIDFDYPPYDDLSVPPEIEERFRVTTKKVLLEGYCQKCLQRKS
jgi:Fur family peroxide stress response transcriptional regulator